MQMISKNKLSEIFKDVNKFEVEDKVCVLIDNLKDNYETWAISCGIGQEQVDKFNTSFDVRPGNKYIKILIVVVYGDSFVYMMTTNLNVEIF